MTDWIAALCGHVGVTSQYLGYNGQRIDVTQETMIAVLRAMGLDVEGQDDARAILEPLRAQDAQRPLPPELIVMRDIATCLPVAKPFDWSLTAEQGGEPLASGGATDMLSLPALPLGIHRLDCRLEGQTHTTWVLARPERAFGLADAVPTPRIWGVLSALYGMTDGDAAGLGSYALLGRYAAAMAEHGSDFLGINPIHAMDKTGAADLVSPYSPTHRAFLNTWHSPTIGPVAGDLIDYPSALQAGHAALDADYEAFRLLPETAPEKRALAGFRDAGGAPLRDFALFEALSAQFGPDWRAWPSQYHEPDSSASRAYADSHGADIEKAIWAQWQADTQLGRAQAQAVQNGMRIGLYLDLAVGPRLGGAETWGCDTGLVSGATLGAPPDPLGPLGQSWGLAPQSPMKIRETGYAGFSRLLRAVMRHAGMIRIDHALGLMRSFWIPDGGTEGTYVAYPLDALLAVVAIESARSGTIVVGEDLGLVPDGLRDKLAASGIYGLDVLQYMRRDDGGFVAPEEMRVQAICGFATHDTPTITGFFNARDARTRADFGGLDAATLDEEIADRTKAASTLDGPGLVDDIHGRLARAPSEMVAVQLDDIAGREAQQNLPGTVKEYPNWRLRAPFSVQDIATSPAFARVAAQMSAQGRTNTQDMEKDNALQDRTHRAN